MKHRNLQRRIAGLVFALLAAGPAVSLAQAVADPYSYKRTSSFTYLPSGMLESETVEPDSPQNCVKTTHGYDEFGNRQSVVTANCAGATGLALFDQRQGQSLLEAYTSAAGIAVPKGTFVTASKVALTGSISDPQTQAETRRHDPRFGAVTALTGPNGLTTTWQVDAFGRKVLELRADGTSTVTHHCLLARSFNGVATDLTSNSDGCASASAIPVAGEAPATAVRYEHSESRDTANQKSGAFSRTYFDRAGRKIRVVTEAFDDPSQPAGAGRVMVQDTDYNAFGAVVITTQPYFLASQSSTTAGSSNYGMTRTDYDALGRSIAIYMADPATATTAGVAGQTGGNQGGVVFGSRGTRQATRTSVSYNGAATTTTDDKGRIRTEERDPEGRVVRVTDNLGAQIVHQFDAFGNLIITKDPLGNLVQVAYDVRGRRLTLNDPDGGVTAYCYDAIGQIRAQQTSAMRGGHAVTACPGVSGAGTTAPTVAGWTTMAYDRTGRLVHRVEAEYATSWSYDRYADGSACAGGMGKLCETRTSHGVVRKTAYDSYGRPKSSRADYGGTAGGGASVSMLSGVTYDPSTGRVATQTYPSGLTVAMQYTQAGYLKALKLVSQVTVNPLPATAGGAAGAAVTLASGTLLWQAQSINAWGKVELQTYANGVNGRLAFDPQTGRLQQITAGKGAGSEVVNQRLTWVSSTNQLWSRVDALGDGTGVEVLDTYQYDGIGRLTRYTVSGGSSGSPSSRTVDLQYNALGMLLYKTDVGTYSYPTQGVANGRPHAVQSITGILAGSYGYDLNGNVISATSGRYRNVSYTSFNLPDGGTGISGPSGSPRYAWQYDENHARISETRTNAQGTRTTWFLHPDNQGGLGFERELGSGGAQSNRHYLTVSGSTIGVIVTTGALPAVAPGQTDPAVAGTVANAVKLEFWHKDHLGSLVATTDHAGNVTGRYAYDPFGKRRYTNSSYDPFGNVVVDWTTDTNRGTDRGFTGHEHLDDIGLIHMNGRVFDPAIARFMQPDPFVQDPTNLQNFDRFAYCFNNPTSCTDPSGYFSLKSLFKVVVGIVIAIYAPQLLQTYLGAFTGAGFFVTAAGATTFAGAATAGFISGAVLGGSLKAGLQGMFSAAMFFGAGELFTAGGSLGGLDGMARSVAQVAVHGVAGCITSVVGGGKCGAGALSAAFSKVMTVSGWTDTSNPVTSTIISAVAGGVASVLGGGKFENGAITGAFSYLFNKMAHTGKATVGMSIGNAEGAASFVLTVDRVRDSGLYPYDAWVTTYDAQGNELTRNGPYPASALPDPAQVGGVAAADSGNFTLRGGVYDATARMGLNRYAAENKYWALDIGSAPSASGARTMSGVWVHGGYLFSGTGSAGCITIRYTSYNAFISNFWPGAKGQVYVNHGP